MLGGLITAAVVVAATPLLGQGADAADAAAVASQLEPLLGRAAPIFFGIGLFAAGLTSAITAPLAAAYAARGSARLGLRPQERPDPPALGLRAADRNVLRIFLGASPYQIILLAQAGNGIFLPLALILLLIVVNKTGIMGKYKNSKLANVLGAFVVLVISGLSLVQLARVLGIAG